MGFKVIIPARYASSRLPGKPLREIAGKPLIQHVYERALASGAEEISIATDDWRIREVAEAFGAVVHMTSPAHETGTERIAEVVLSCAECDDTIIVNLQGDEPQMSPQLIDQVAGALEAHPDAQSATLCARIEDKAVLFDPNTVKVVLDNHGYALYFSRAPIPWARTDFDANARSLGLPLDTTFYRHIGIYAYRAGYLKRFSTLAPCILERTESLEQLRMLFHGGRIYVEEASEQPGHHVETAEDLQKVQNLFQTNALFK
ncbi:MAG: 3-deoxy-manno-octulosonate cytidylyltransferase [Gammaproteobacteria bacterium]|nr:3-deoxy-manno-octulosonate cytidylyltransferase [Gammaproteobacteria bacterium]MCI0590180.1 3-deoxy-manno-octulosonate cytidylyltransferase [Gammaproteobacteria bacterium]